ATWFGQRLLQLAQGCLWQQVEMDDGAALSFDALTDGGGEGVDQAAFDALLGEDELADAAVVLIQSQGDVLQWRTGKTFAQVFAPARYLKAAIARSQRCDGNAACLQQRLPCAIGTQPGPTAAAKGEQGGVGLMRVFAVRSVQTQAAVGVPAQPARARV